MNFESLPDDIVYEIYLLKHKLEWKDVVSELKNKQFNRYLLKVKKRLTIKSINLRILIKSTLS